MAESKASKTKKVKKSKARPVGRPSKFTDKIGDEICNELSQGLSLRTICKSEKYPSCVTVFAWLRERPEFLKQYEIAKAEGADAMAEEMLEIADDGTNDWMEKYGRDGEKTGEYVLNGEHVQRSRLRVDARKWYLSKIKPKVYGDKVDLTSDGEKLEQVTRVEIVAGGNSSSTASS